MEIPQLISYSAPVTIIDFRKHDIKNEDPTIFMVGEDAAEMKLKYAKLKFMYYPDTKTFNVTDANGIVHSFYASNDTANFRCPDIERQSGFRRQKHLNVSIDEFIGLVKSPDTLYRIVRGEA